MNTRKLAKLDALMNQLIFAFMQKGMTYKQAKEEVFRMLKRKRLQGNGRRLRINSHIPPSPSCSSNTKSVFLYTQHRKPCLFAVEGDALDQSRESLLGEATMPGCSRSSQL